MNQPMQTPVEEIYEMSGEVRTSSRPAVEETYGGEVSDSRKFSDAIEARIAALATTDDDEPTPDEIADPPPEDVEAPEEVALDAVTTTEPETKPVPDEIATLRAEIDRLSKLVAQPAPSKPEPEAEAKPEPVRADPADSYIEDDLGALRAFIARGIGVEPDSKEVDAELELLYTSLTSKSLGVTPDPAHQAARDIARTRQLLARQKRERQDEVAASAAKAKAEAEAAKAREAHSVIGKQLASSVSDYPLLMNHAKALDGMEPADVVARVIHQHAKAGRIDQETLADDAKLIAYAANQIETHYRKIADQFRTPPTNPNNQSTVTPSAKSPAANESSAKSATAPKPTQKSTRTLTNADASVAPATPVKPAKPNQGERPKFKTDAERRDYALRNLPK